MAAAHHEWVTQQPEVDESVVVQLEPVEARRRSRWPVAALTLVLLVFAGAVTWLVLREQHDPLAYYTPTNLPSGFTTNQAWMRDDSYQPEGLQVAPGYPKTFYGGKAGDDGRLDAWIDVAKTESMSVAIEVTREVSVGGQPGYLWSSSSGENRAFLRAEARSDDLIEAQSVGVAEADIIDALASLRCDGDLVYLDPPPRRERVVPHRATAVAIYRATRRRLGHLAAGLLDRLPAAGDDR